MQEIKQNVQTLTLSESQTCLFSSSHFISLTQQQEETRLLAQQLYGELWGAQVWSADGSIFIFLM